MQQKWSIEFADTNIHRFIADQALNVTDVRVQPFLSADITWEHSPKGWVLSLYPGFYREGPVEATILHALAGISRRSHPWFEETPAEEFDRLTKEFLDLRRTLNPHDREMHARTIVGIDSAVCSALDLFYLVSRGGYLTLEQVTNLTRYRSENFVSPEAAVQFLAAMAILRILNGHPRELYEQMVRYRQYELLSVLDRVEDCVKSSRVVHDDSVAIFDKLLPFLREGSFLDTIAVLRRNVVGQRDDSEIDFDVAISYASEDRIVAEDIAAVLIRERLRVFYDRYVQAELWGKDLHQHLTDVYRRRARFCVLVISTHYASKLWPTVEREAMVARIVGENVQWLLPLRVDDTAVPGLSESIAHIDLRFSTQDEVCELIVKRIRLTT